MLTDPSLRTSVTIHRSPLRTQAWPLRRRRSLWRVMTRSPLDAAVPSCRTASRVGFTVPSMIRSARARVLRMVTVSCLGHEDRRESCGQVAAPCGVGSLDHRFCLATGDPVVVGERVDRVGQFSEIWPTSGWMHDGSAYPLPSSAHPSPLSRLHPGLPPGHCSEPLWPRTRRAGARPLDQVRARWGTIALSHQVIDLAVNGPPGSRNRRNESETLWLLIGSVFDAGEATPTASPDENTSRDATPQPPHS